MGKLTIDYQNGESHPYDSELFEEALHMAFEIEKKNDTKITRIQWEGDFES